jgi:uncharacterized metal-binding protein YceD (DUF177 family)
MSEQSSGKQTSPKQTSPNPPWSLPVAVAEIPETGKRFDLVPDAQRREAIARVAAVAALPRLKAGFELTRHGRDGLRVVGFVSATVEQNCVVTLEPIQSEVEEAIDLVFAPPQPLPSEHAATDEPKVLGEDLEILHDGMIDLGAVAIEFLILGIDLYPRKPEAVFDASKPEENAADLPFAVLAALKKGKPEQGS